MNPEDLEPGFEVLAYLEACIDAGRFDEAAALILAQVSATESFVYSLSLAEQASMASKPELVKQCLKHAESMVDRGNFDPVTDDVEAEDNYYAEVAERIVHLTGDRGWAERVLIAGVEHMPSTFDGTSARHLLYVANQIDPDLAARLELAIQTQDDDEEE